MDYFCLIYPDAVFNGIASKILEQFLRAGLNLVSRSVRKLNIEEARSIFYSRRHNQDFDRFCKAMTCSNVWLLHLQTDGDIVRLLAEALHPDLTGEFFIPREKDDNELFLKLIERHSNDELEDIFQELRERLNCKDSDDDKVFTSYSLEQGQKLFSYMTAMRAVGFSQAEAFELTRNIQIFLFEREIERLSSEGNEDSDEENADDSEDDDDNYSDTDEDGI